MRRFWLPIGVCVIVCVAVVLVFLSHRPARETVTLIPAASTQRNSLSVYGVSPIVASALRRHLRYHCGHAVNKAHLVKGVGRQRFQHCRIEEHVRVYRLARATPRPVRTPIAPPAISSPVPPATIAPVFPVAPTAGRTMLVPSSTATPVVPIAPIQHELSLINQSRSSLGLPPYVLNITESAGTATCPGSQGHADHMANVGAISHDQFPGDICLSGWSSIGENVGEAGGYGVEGALDIIHQQMMVETPFSYGCTGSHRCNIMSPSFRQVGIGITTVNGTTFMAVDFIG